MSYWQIVVRVWWVVAVICGLLGAVFGPAALGVWLVQSAGWSKWLAVPLVLAVYPFAVAGIIWLGHRWDESM